MSNKHHSFIGSSHYGFTESRHHMRNFRVVDEQDNTGDPVVDGGASRARSVFKLDKDGTVIWAYDTGSTARGVGHSDGITWAVGNRSYAWWGNDGSTTQTRTAWKLDNHGRLITTADTGGRLQKVYMTGGPEHGCVAVGERSNVWSGGSTYASVWMIDGEGEIKWAYDTGDDLWDVFYDKGVVYATGDRSSSKSIWAIDGGYGTLLWSFDTAGDMRGMHGDGAYLYAAGSAQSTWTGSGGVQANTWKMLPSGTVVWGVMVKPDTTLSGVGSISGCVTTYGGNVYITFGAGDNQIVASDGSGNEIWDGERVGNSPPFPQGVLGDKPEGITANGEFVWGTSAGHYDEWNANGDMASLWKMNKSTGTIIWGWNGVHPGSPGATSYTHDVYTDDTARDGSVWVANHWDSQWEKYAKTP